MQQSIKILVDLSLVCEFWINHINHFDGDGEKVLRKNGIEGEVWHESSIEGLLGQSDARTIQQHCHKKVDYLTP